MHPKIYVVSRPQIDDRAIDEFLASEDCTWKRNSEASDPENVVEFAGRLCYMSYQSEPRRKTNFEYIKNLVDQGHESVLEHATWTFIISGVSRAFTHQLVRHRIGFSFSQLSQQYYEDKNAELVEPPSLKGSPRAYAVWKRATDIAKDAYKEMLTLLKEDESFDRNKLSHKECNRGIRSAARGVLPNAIETKIVVTANARALRNFLILRGAILGDEEMRIFSAALLKILHVEAHSLFYDFKLECLSDGSPWVSQLRETDLAVHSNDKIAD